MYFLVFSVELLYFILVEVSDEVHNVNRSNAAIPIVVVKDKSHFGAAFLVLLANEPSYE